MNITDDLYLDDANDGDVARYVETFSDPAMSHNLLLVPYPYTAEDARWFIKYAQQRRIEQGGMWNFVIRSRAEGGALVGGVTLDAPGTNPGLAELAAWLAKSHWGNGIMAAVLQYIIDYVKDQKSKGLMYTDIIGVEGHIFTRNTQSARLVQKMGWKFVEHLPNHYNKNGELIDADRYTCMF